MVICVTQLDLESERALGIRVGQGLKVSVRIGIRVHGGGCTHNGGCIRDSRYAHSSMVVP